MEEGMEIIQKKIKLPTKRSNYQR